MQISCIYVHQRMLQLRPSIVKPQDSERGISRDEAGMCAFSGIAPQRRGLLPEVLLDILPFPSAAP